MNRLSVARVDTAALDETLSTADGVVLVEFWGSGCAPCAAMVPVLEELAEEADGLTVLTVSLDDSPDLGARFGVLAVPTLLFFVDGTLRRRLVGARSKARLKEELAGLGG